MTKKDHRSPLAKARDKWLHSDEGKRGLDLSILKAASQKRFLKNRLESAFLAGAKWAKENPTAIITEN